MVSLKLRDVFYSAALGAEKTLEERRKRISALAELEAQLKIARKIADRLEEKRKADPAMMLRIEGRMKQIEKQLLEKKKDIINA
jgi:hypothetical protein